MTSRKTHLDTLAISLLLACCLFWGFQQVLVKATLPEVAPAFQAAIRFAGATVLLGLWCAWRGVKLFSADGSLRAGLLAGSLFAGEFACLYLGLQYTSASRLTVFLYTSPFWVAALLPIWVKSETLRPLQWVGLACAFAAVAFALREGFSAAGAPTWVGDVMALVAGMLWGLTTVVIRASSLARVSPEKLLFYQVAVSTVTLPLLSLALGERWSWSFSPFALTSLVLQTVVGAFASYLAWMWMLGRYPATKISVFVFLTPLFALLFGALWLHESATPSLLAALVLVALGIVLVNRKPA
ncbi:MULTISPECIES: DMT family transporter [unclassified Polaromonas]|jgi:drug/metabolite transporter (DMT)-like permease|uniref:DMT family transporter n=1 Tax=unclassified Polaromonas TaxID=2638319 RepID=UPI000BDA66D2|nr:MULTISPECIES: DMT family transporter [unclassified Polaromonas]OYY34082.1 MAG: EamA family transporter [Polaromonas sp. 35-63-35]OYZ20902.1 MAG: EamA family transporter [Polaromonas sp. 16-63-31]OYZ78500.1 MAG: EamA family transporter [Polaromonas sp. 24-63-21]OZA49068.1 MAG: EamA family transporter [Polaromonas sp. 17-63-33]OZA88956.1 MAG: EamA family transporter [Polaromonas sp. 39-63-25]